MKNILEKCWLLLYPQMCGCCGKLGEGYLCKKCQARLQPHFHKKKISNPYFQHLFYLFPYQGEIRHLLLRYKFQKQSYLFRTFAEIFIKNKKMCSIFQNYDIIVPVPISKKRKQERGYNQSALIAREVAKHFPIEYAPQVLRKIKHTPPQSSLCKEERRQNVKSAYKIQFPEKIHHKKVLLLDDIYTTGNTAEACSQLLHQAGAKEVAICTIAKD